MLKVAVIIGSTRPGRVGESVAIAGGLVLGKAEECCRRIVELYRRPNMTSDQISAAFEANELDILKEFSSACRMELLAMSSAA